MDMREYRLNFKMKHRIMGKQLLLHTLQFDSAETVCRFEHVLLPPAKL